MLAKVSFLSFIWWRLSLERTDSLQNSIGNSHRLSKQQIFLHAPPSTSGTRPHYLLLLDNAWHLKIEHNSDHIWTSKRNRSSIYHKHWNFIVGTIKLLGLSSTETWISYLKAETIPSRERGRGCPVLKPNRWCCSMSNHARWPQHQRTVPAMFNLLVLMSTKRLSTNIQTGKKTPKEWIHLQWALLKAKATKTCQNVIVPNRQ